MMKRVSIKVLITINYDILYGLARIKRNRLFEKQEFIIIIIIIRWKGRTCLYRQVNNNDVECHVQ